MKKITALLMCSFLFGCSTPQGTYKEQENPMMSTSRSFMEEPAVLARAARAVLEDLIHDSDPPVSTPVKESSNSYYSGWVYATSKDKYVEYSFNGSPQRKKLQVRRKFTYNISPGLSGSQVTVEIQEEVQKVDLNSGSPTGWDSVSPDTTQYDAMIKKLREKVRAQ